MGRSIDPSLIWVAQSGDRILYAVLPVPNAGRTMLLMAPGRIPSLLHERAASVLINEIAAYYRQRGFEFAQVLLDTAEHPLLPFYQAVQFQQMAELLYLQASAGRVARSLALPDGFFWTGYSATTHDQFAQTMSRSYIDSLDCPCLSGLRDIEDIIAGHKSAGEFNPSYWKLLCNNKNALGVLILAHLEGGEAMEVVYLGLVPSARGQDLADLLIRQAFSLSGAAGCQRIHLAVDSINAPALKLYYRHGFRRVQTRLALLRDLRRTISVPATIS